MVQIKDSATITLSADSRRVWNQAVRAIVDAFAELAKAVVEAVKAVAKIIEAWTPAMTARSRHVDPFRHGGPARITPRGVRP